MISVDEIVVVEGVYDRHTLTNFLDATIIETDGFHIFKDKETALMLKTLAQTRGVIILTDSDRAGFAIRKYLTDFIGKEHITQVYIPDIYGKERRKQKPSKENKLGVEGMTEDIIKTAFENAGVFSKAVQKPRFLKKYDFYEYGLSGGKNSVMLRAKLKKALKLPENLSANRLLEVLNVMLDREEFEKLIEEIVG